MAQSQDLQRQELMQSELDGNLPEEMARDLLHMLRRDQDASHEYERLRRMDSLLKQAPQQRAPARLAAAIMARVAQQVQAQSAASELSPEMQRVLMLSLSAAMMTMMPMMEAASWLVLHARRKPELISDLMVETLAWLPLLTRALIQLLDDAEALARSQPAVAAATLALTPYMLQSILDYLSELSPKDGDTLLSP